MKKTHLRPYNPMAKSAYYLFQQKLTSSRLEVDTDQIPNWEIVRTHLLTIHRPLPADYKPDGPLLISSPKEKPYDLLYEWLVSERLAELIDQFAGDTVRLIPFDTILPNPKAKYPPTCKYYLLEPAYVPHALIYVEGEPILTPNFPLYAFWNKNVRPGIDKRTPILEIKLDLEKVKPFALFKPTEPTGAIFMSHALMQACKKAKIYGMEQMNAEYDLEMRRKIKNQHNNLPHLTYRLNKL